METHKTYISYVIQSEKQQVYDFEIVNLPCPTFALYTDNTSQEVVLWSKEKQKTLPSNSKLIILNFFNISNVN